MASMRIAIVMLLSCLAGCGGDGGPPGTDGGAGMDGSADSDPGSGDAGPGTDDAGPGEDDAGAGSSDSGAGSSDSGAATDSAIDPDAAPDGGPPVSMPCAPAGACDPFEPSPCPAGEACRLGATGLDCYPHDPAPLAEGSPCDAPADCAPGTMCLSFPGTGFVCTRLCADGSIGACGDGRACTGTVGDACVQACRPIPAPCDIYDQDCADPAQTCTLTRHPETDAPYTGCRPAGARTEGQTCGGTDGTCGHDLICIRTADVTACRQPCDAAAGDPCPAGQACTGRSVTWRIGYCAPTAP